MDFNLLSKRYLFIFLTIFVIGCGGSSGGQDSTPITTPISTPPPMYSLKITEDNSGVIAYGAIYAEGILQLSDSALSVLFDHYGFYTREWRRD